MAQSKALNTVFKVRDILSVREPVYGTKGDGSIETSAIQAAANDAAGKILYFPEPASAYAIDAAIDLNDDTEVVFHPAAILQSATTSISLLEAANKSNVRIKGAHLKYTAAGASALIGGVDLNTCTHCLVEDCELEGMQWSGVLLTDSNYCTVRNNHIHDTLGTHSDTHDIGLYGVSAGPSYNRVEGNRCLGSGGVGVFQQGTGASIPFRNIISQNRVNEKLTYGIMCYQITAADTETQVINNIVSDILGTGLSGAGGSGIYLQNSGGCIVTGNDVSNCCRSTTSSSLAPSGISVSFGSALRKTNVVANNRVDAPKWYGIFINEAGNETICAGNTVTFSDATNGRGIWVSDSSYTAVINNRVSAPITVARPLINISASANDCVGNDVSGNTLSGGNGNMLSFNVTGANRHKKTRVNGNTCTSTGASAQGLVCSGLSSSTINHNTIDAPAVGFYVDSVVDCRGSGNVVVQGTANGFLSGGTCSNTYFDASNYWGASTTLVQNTAAGVNIAVRYAVVPASGNWQVGDEWINPVQAASTSPGSYCVAAGAPGTWKARAALAA